MIDRVMTRLRNSPDFDNIVHFVISRTSSHELGATKLNKVLWVADKMSWQDNEKSLTGLNSYKRMPKGPVPGPITPSLKRLKETGRIDEFSDPKYMGRLRMFRSLKEPDIESLSGATVDYLMRAIAYVTPMTASQISEETHDAYWQELSDGDDMDIGAAAMVIGDMSVEELDWARAQMAQ